MPECLTLDGILPKSAENAFVNASVRDHPVPRALVSSVPSGTGWRFLRRVAFSLVTIATLNAQLEFLGVKSGESKSAPPATPAQGSVRKGFVPPAAPAEGPAPFLTEAVDWAVVTAGKPQENLLYPTKTQTQAPLYAVPFAVHIPFEVPFEGGATRVFFDVNIVWDEPEQKTVLRQPGFDPRPLFPKTGGGWKFYQQGVYRLDGAAIAPDTVAWEVSPSESVPMTWQTDAPFPLLLNGSPPVAGRGISVTTRLDINSTISTPTPRRPFTNERDQVGSFATSRPLVLRSGPGRYVLWFTLHPEVWAWPPAALRPDGTLQAKLYVHTLVTRHGRVNGDGPYPLDFAYIWHGADKKPFWPVDPKLVLPHTVVMPLKFRRDGWQFVRAEARRLRDSSDHLDRGLPPRESSEMSGAQVSGDIRTGGRVVTATYASRIFERKDRTLPFPQAPVRSSTLTWDVTFPAEIPDGGIAEIVAKGGIKREGGDEAFRSRKLSEVHLGDYIPRWIGRPIWPSEDPRGIASKMEYFRNDDASDLASYVKSWGWKVGDEDGKRYWQQIPEGPPPPGREYRFIVAAKPLDPYISSHTSSSGMKFVELFYKDLGAHALYSMEIGPWKVEAYYRRMTHLEKGSAVATVSEPVKVVDEKDPFWEWYPRYSLLLREKLAEAEALERENAVERELLQATRRMVRSVLDAVQSANDPGSLGDYFGSGETRATLSDEMILRMAARAR